VFVAGATGETGARVVRALVAAGYAVRAGVRNRAKADALGLTRLAGVTVVDADLTHGDDLATALDVQPGPRLGRLLAQIAEEQAAGTITNADEAIAFARTAPLED
jgi:nucleoside-diphosphate-sugar epimerase